jgi:hypothetical protein
MLTNPVLRSQRLMWPLAAELECRAHDQRAPRAVLGTLWVLPGASERRGHTAGRYDATDADQARTAHTSVWRAPPASSYEVV